jgi:hypothetical protein
LMDERKSSGGLWAGLSGAGLGLGSFLYALFGGAK